MLLTDGVKYKLRIPKDEEKEFHPMIKEHSKEIFGENSLYFDVKHKLRSRSGIGSIPDAYVVKLSKPHEWYVIENELASHSIYNHIINQLTKFMNGLRNPKSRNDILEAIDEEIRTDRVLRAYIEKTISSPEIYRFMSKLLSQSPKIVVVIDELNEQVKEACQSLKYETRFVEFKTYIREDAENVHVHQFEPLFVLEEEYEKGKLSDAAKRAWKTRKTKLPPHYESYEKMLAWIDDNTKNVVETLTRLILNRFDNVSHRASGRHYMFCKGKLTTTKSAFVAFILTKKHLKVRIRTDPRTLRDPDRLLNEKVYAGWFFKEGEAREFKMTDIEQIDSAMELIKHSYEVTK